MPVEIGILCTKIPAQKDISLLAHEQGVNTRYLQYDTSSSLNLLLNSFRIAKFLKSEYSVVLSLTLVPNIICATFSLLGGYGVWQQRDVITTKALGFFDILFYFMPKVLISNSSNGVLYLTRKTLGLKKILLMPNLPDFRFKSAGLKRYNENDRALFTFCYIANYSKIKGHLKLLQAWNKFTEILGDNFRLIISGNNGDAYEEIVAFLDNLIFPETVLLLPQSNAEQIDSIFNASNVNILASYSEGRSNVVDRASQHSLATIGSSIPSAFEQLSIANHFLLADPTSTSRLCELLVFAANNQSELAEVGKMNKIKIENYFKESNRIWLDFLSKNLLKN